MGKYFGTDGFRGEVNVALTAQHAFSIGRFLPWYYSEQKRRLGDASGVRVVIGKDTRRSGDMLQSALVAGLLASGADIDLMCVTTTPSVAYAARQGRYDCGVMITASHNPYYDNGIKLLNADGEKIEDAVEEMAEAYLDGRLVHSGQPCAHLPYATREMVGVVHEADAQKNAYRAHLLACAPTSLRGYRIGLDCANGSASAFAKDIFDALGAKTYAIHTAPDGLNINRNAGSTHIESLQRLVKEHGLDIGFAYDGDADRCLCVDEKGNVLTGDHILYACGTYLHACGALRGNCVVATVMSNMGLVRGLAVQGIACVQTAVGDKFVYEAMRRDDYVLGGEQSGHIVFGDLATTGDGILTSLKLMELMIAQKQPASAIAAAYQPYPQLLRNLFVSDKQAAVRDDDVRGAVEQANAVLGERGRVVLRVSGTEPLLRLMVEAQNAADCQIYQEQLVQLLTQKGYLRA
jgi:phosphoglucosamine mutase